MKTPLAPDTQVHLEDVKLRMPAPDGFSITDASEDAAGRSGDVDFADDRS
jgi:hypothetical protein